MGFKLVKSDTFKRDVEIIAPDGTQLIAKGVEFKYLPEGEFEERAESEGDDVIRDIVVGWDEFYDAQDNEVVADEETLDEIFQLKPIVAAFIVTYTKALYGLDAKNFLASLQLGQQIKAKAARKKRSNKKKARKRN